MAYSDATAQREYQRRWKHDRRAAWFDGKTCARCGGTDRLEIHHRAPEKKVSHRIWSWSLERRDEELAKCDVLCRPCHELTHWPAGRDSSVREARQRERDAAHAWLAEYDRRRRERLEKRRVKRFRTGAQ